MSWWHRSTSSRKRVEVAALEEQVKALQAAVANRTVAVGRSTGRRCALVAFRAATILIAGVVLGLSSDRLTQAVAHTVAVVGLAGPAADADAAYAAYENGYHECALRLAQPLAEQGDARAQSLVGLIHYIGRGAIRDNVKAVKWLRLAADQGNANAQFRLGLVYSEGHGAPQDHAEAAKWFRLAAEQRHPQAQYNLGLLYATGEGVAQDNVMAHMWFNLAVVQFPASDASNRNAAIRNRDILANRLTPEQITQAQKLAHEWEPVHRAQLAGGTS